MTTIYTILCTERGVDNVFLGAFIYESQAVQFLAEQRAKIGPACWMEKYNSPTPTVSTPAKPSIQEEMLRLASTTMEPMILLRRTREHTGAGLKELIQVFNELKNSNRLVQSSGIKALDLMPLGEEKESEDHGCCGACRCCCGAL